MHLKTRARCLKQPYSLLPKPKGIQNIFKRMNKYSVVHPNEGMLPSAKKKRAISPCKEVANKTNILCLVKERILKRQPIILAT